MELDRFRAIWDNRGMIRSLKALALVVALAVSGCMPFHTDLPGVIDLRDEDPKAQHAQFQIQRYRFWLLFFVPLNRPDFSSALAGHMSAETGLANLTWESEVGLLGVGVTGGLTIAALVLSGPIGFHTPLYLLVQSRTVRIRGDVIAVPVTP